MTRHLRIHTIGEPDFCPYCPYRAVTLPTIQRHVDDEHRGKYLFYAVSVYTVQLSYSQTGSSDVSPFMLANIWQLM